jgi:hypothetical protein
MIRRAFCIYQLPLLIVVLLTFFVYLSLMSVTPMIFGGKKIRSCGLPYTQLISQDTDVIRILESVSPGCQAHL